MSECTVSMRGYGMSCKKQYSFSMYLIGRLFFFGTENIYKNKSFVYYENRRTIVITVIFDSIPYIIGNCVSHC